MDRLLDRLTAPPMMASRTAAVAVPTPLIGNAPPTARDGEPVALVDRHDEVVALDRLLDTAREGAAAALVVHGDAGIGKTALLDQFATIPRSSTSEAPRQGCVAGRCERARPASRREGWTPNVSRRHPHLPP